MIKMDEITVIPIFKDVVEVFVGILDHLRHCSRMLGSVLFCTVRLDGMGGNLFHLNLRNEQGMLPEIGVKLIF